MLFSVIVVVVFLPYQFLQVSSLHEKSHNVIENFQDLFNAVARNKSKTLTEFTSTLIEGKKRLEKEFDDIKSSLSDHRKHHYQSIHTGRNITTKREAGKELEVFNRKKALTKLEKELVKLSFDEQILHLKTRVVDEEEENFRLGGIIGEIRGQKNSAVKLSETVGVFGYLRSLLEMYEWLLYNADGKLVKVTDEDLRKLGLPVDLTDHTVKNSLRTHYAKWLGILQGEKIDSRIEYFKLEILPKLGFKDDYEFAKYAAFLFCQLSNIGHNFPSNLITYNEEEDVIEALKSWKIMDEKLLNTARAFYRLVRAPVVIMTTEGSSAPSP